MDIEIFIPTQDRPEFLARSLFYYNKKDDIFDNLKIYIADSSGEVNFYKNKETISKLKPHLNITHDKYSKEEYGSLGSKLFVSTQKITGKYVIFSGDDDFIVAENIIPQYVFLEKNNNYIGCHGARVDFKLKPLESNLSNNISKSVSYNITGMIPGPYWKDNDPIIRLITYMRFGIANVQFAMLRNNVFKYVYSHLNDIDLAKDHLFGIEILVSLKTILSGDIKRINGVITTIRQAHSDSSRPTLSSLLESEKYSIVIKKSKKIIIDTLQSLGYNKEISEYLTNKEFAMRLIALLNHHINETYGKDNDLNNRFRQIDEEYEREQSDKRNIWIPPTQIGIEKTIVGVLKECIGGGIDKVPIR